GRERFPPTVSGQRPGTRRTTAWPTPSLGRYALPSVNAPWWHVQEPDLGSYEGDRHRARKSEGSDGLRAAEIGAPVPGSGSRAFPLSGEAFPGLPMVGESMLRLG